MTWLQMRSLVEVNGWGGGRSRAPRILKRLCVWILSYAVCKSHERSNGQAWKSYRNAREYNENKRSLARPRRAGVVSSASQEREHNYTRNISRHKRMASFSRTRWLRPQGEWWLADFLRNNFKGAFELASKEWKYFYNVDAESHRGNEHTGKLPFLPTPWFLMWFLVFVGKWIQEKSLKPEASPKRTPQFSTK